MARAKGRAAITAAQTTEEKEGDVNEGFVVDVAHRKGKGVPHVCSSREGRSPLEERQAWRTRGESTGWNPLAWKSVTVVPISRLDKVRHRRRDRCHAEAVYPRVLPEHEGGSITYRV
jgi:hypothetical protein